MNGVVLYVDLIRLEEVADRYSQIDMQMKSLLSSYERSISYLKGCEYRGEIPPNIIGVHNAEMQEIEERIRSLQSCLKSVLDIYRGYEKEFHAREIGNLYETTPFYKTNGFKIGVGAIVVTDCVVLAVVAFPRVAIVTGAAVGEATATAELVVSVVANGVTDSAIYAGETAYRGGEITSRGLTVSFLTGAVLSGVTRIGVGKYTKAKGIESGRKSIDGLNIIDGKVDGKIPLVEYEKYRADSVHNINSDTMTLGKYEPTMKVDGTKDFSMPGPGAYTVKAGDTTYFSLGTEWDKITDTYDLDLAGQNMFDYFNKPALDDAISAGKEMRFSHNPEVYGECALKWEWDYLQERYGYFALEKKGDFWYATK